MNAFEQWIDNNKGEIPDIVYSAYHDAGAKDVVLVYINGADVITVTRADISMAIVNGYDITVGHTVINI